jgi:predicted ABC-type ATPase
VQTKILQVPMKRRSQAVIIAGPNGAGKSTLAPRLLREEFDIHIYVNADDIARELAGDDPQSAAMEAGRIVHARLQHLRQEKADFAIETTLSGLALRRTVDRLGGAGYDVHLVYMWLPSPDLAVNRVRTRVILGGHDVPEDDIRRRILRSVCNFMHVYRGLVSFWRVYDARVSPGEKGPSLIARGGRDVALEVYDALAWNELQFQANLKEEVDDA